MYDVIIIGGGPAGLSAAVYASRFKMKTLLITPVIGGNVNEAFLIENYLGFKSIQGGELAQKFAEHASAYGAEIKTGERVVKIEKANGYFTITTDIGNIYDGKTLILATGLKKRKLGIPGEEEFKGKGVSYCAVCDAFFFRDKVVAVIGGGASAITGALKLAEVAKKVYVIYRRGKENLRAEPIWIERALSNPKIEFIFHTNVKEIRGNESVNCVILDNPYKGNDTLDVEGVFIEIGSIPDLNLPKQVGLETDEDGTIKVNEDCSTNVEGVFAAGDITTGSNRVRQIITAAAEGAIAAISVFMYLKRKGGG